jgi:hypothetical protein
MKTLKHIIEASLLDIEGTIKAGDDYVTHQKMMKKEFAMLKKVKITDLEEWVKHDENDVVYRYSWMCPAILKEYFGEFVEKDDIKYLDIYICCKRMNSLSGYFEITICPINSKDIAVLNIEEESIFYQACNQRDWKIFKSNSGVDQLLEVGLKTLTNTKFKEKIEEGLLKLQSYMKQ